MSFYEFADQDPGLLIWRRDLSEQPILIVADERRIVDARDLVQHPPVPVYQDQLSDPFPVSTDVYTPTDRYTPYAQPAVAAVYAHTDSVGLRQTTDWEPAGAIETSAPASDPPPSRPMGPTATASPHPRWRTMRRWGSRRPHTPPQYRPTRLGGVLGGW